MMFTTLLLLPIVAAVPGDGTGSSIRPLPFETEYVTGRVIRVSDARTLRVRISGEIYPIQLAGVEGLDRSHPYQRKALDRVQHALRGHEVRVRPTGWVGERRLLTGDVWLGHENVAEHLIEAGLVRNLWRDNPRRMRLEQVARREQNGLWNRPAVASTQLAGRTPLPSATATRPIRTVRQTASVARPVPTADLLTTPTLASLPEETHRPTGSVDGAVRLPLRIVAPMISDSRLDAGLLR